MKINIKQEIINNIFYNKLSLIIYIFAIIFLSTSYIIQTGKLETLYKTTNDEYSKIVGPINVFSKPVSYEVYATLSNNSKSCDINGEILDWRKQNILYSFNKYLWKRVVSEPDTLNTTLNAKFTFKKTGIYYIRFIFDKADKSINIEVDNNIISHVPHFYGGMFLFIIASILFLMSNRYWLSKYQTQESDD